MQSLYLMVLFINCKITFLFIILSDARSHDATVNVTLLKITIFSRLWGHMCVLLCGPIANDLHLLANTLSIWGVHTYHLLKKQYCSGNLYAWYNMIAMKFSILRFWKFCMSLLIMNYELHTLMVLGSLHYRKQVDILISKNQALQIVYLKHIKLHKLLSYHG